MKNFGLCWKFFSIQTQVDNAIVESKNEKISSSHTISHENKLELYTHEREQEKGKLIDDRENY